ncbi:MAG: DUF134 domain-containing protein [Syntrophomonadaceae bacterium]|jgi:predicted DNA-binding protein (UPF0251 family)/predicted Fe-Mo cluster-binding NifX family protein
MPRKTKCRKVGFIPLVKVFKPVGIPLSALEEVVLKVEEIEAIRLKNLLNLEQEECAEMMRISRPTFQRILGDAYSKIADALSNGKGIRIEGGSYCLGNGYCRRRNKVISPDENCEFYDAGMGLQQSQPDENWPNNLIAVASDGTTPSSIVEERFGYAHYFLLWNPYHEKYSLLEINHKDEGPGLGTESAQKLIKAGVGILIVNKIGPKAFTLLERANIAVYTGASGKTVDEAINMLGAQQLTKLEVYNN